jgi:S1-C subfamily serine protease
MNTSPSRLWTLAALAVPVALAASLLLMPSVRADDLDEEQEKAVKAAVKAVAPSVVKIETSGGTEIVKGGRGPGVRRGVGPTTGLVVSADGHIISSAFNFANKPAQIRVTVPGLKERKVAHVVATDQTRMLTLLKITDLPEGTKLPVPKPTPKPEIQIGLTSIAVGRTLTSEGADLPSISVGIISALDRIWGKAIQTDAKVSPTNYGGPLVDLQGRVQGVLVPASPQAEGELAGFEWYDSGIGFAIPLEAINAVLPRMMKGTAKEPVVLKRGYVGITMKSANMYEGAPVIGTVAPGSAAEKAGLKPDDRVTEIEGKKLDNYAQMQNVLGGKYEGDTVSIKVSRGKEEKAFPKVVLGSPEMAFPQAFMGILPVRDDPEPGVEVRYVYPKSPADVAGLKAGDRIMKVTNPTAPPKSPYIDITRGRDNLLAVMEIARPGQTLAMKVKRKGGATDDVNVLLVAAPETVPESIPGNASAKKALVKPGVKPPPAPAPAAPAKKLMTGFVKNMDPAAVHTYWTYVPDSYDPNIAYSVLVWFHPLGKNKEADIEDFSDSWSTFCEDNNTILICPQSENPRGWTPGEAEFVAQAIRTVGETYTIDRKRIVTHGLGVGGEMAYYLAFQQRILIRGVAAVGAGLGSNPREKVTNQPLSFFLVVGGKDPVKPNVAATKTKLNEFKYNVILREVTNMGHEYIDGKAGKPTLEELVRWMDSLDRI